LISSDNFERKKEKKERKKAYQSAGDGLGKAVPLLKGSI
jgi:hypothetical protein